MPYHHVTFEERYVIAQLRLAGFRLRAIEQRLGRHHTTVGRGPHPQRSSGGALALLV